MEANGTDQAAPDKVEEPTVAKPGKASKPRKMVDVEKIAGPATPKVETKDLRAAGERKRGGDKKEDRGPKKERELAEVAIKVKNLKKDFYISHSGVASLKSHLLKLNKQEPIERLQVLKGISFEVRKGECVAVVGRNGAGKSTLLSLLSRIYLPTSGSVEIRGRMAPLLELGGGFHPDLTGYENIFVNGMILGITHEELEERVDEIVEFSELSSHIDSPVRTYSSGMNARLGFSIAVHVDAEVLLLDEVLAVGDFSFRDKCAKKIDEMRAEGKTILLVSHSGADVERLADRAIWLQSGLIRAEGSPKKVLQAYVKSSMSELVTEDGRQADTKFEYVYYEDDEEPEKPTAVQPATGSTTAPAGPALPPFKLPEIPPVRSPGNQGVPIFQWSDQGFGIFNLASSDTAAGPSNRASINLGAKNYPAARGDTIASFNATTWGGGIPKPTGALVFSNAEQGPQSAGNIGTSFSIGLCEGGTDAIKARFIIRHNGDVLLSGSPAALPSDSAGGFLYKPRMSSAPTGKPIGSPSSTPYVDDTGNNLLWRYNESWKPVQADSVIASKQDGGIVIMSAPYAFFTYGEPADITLAIPSPVEWPGAWIKVKWTELISEKAITIIPGAGKIEGQPNYRLKSDSKSYPDLMLQSDGVNWWKVSG